MLTETSCPLAMCLQWQCWILACFSAPLAGDLSCTDLLPQPSCHAPAVALPECQITLAVLATILHSTELPPQPSHNGLEVHARDSAFPAVQMDRASLWTIKKS